MTPFSAEALAFAPKLKIERAKACADTIEQTVTDLIEAFLSPRNVR
jgi:hypothetical protein